MDTFQVQVQHQFDQLQAEITTLRAQLALQTTQPPPRLRTRLPDPEKFAGSTYKFDTWLPSIKAKLRVDGEAIGDAIAQFYYVYLNLDSAVQSMVLPQLSRAEEVQRWDYNSILEQLARVYDNPNKQQEAEDKLYSLRQGTDSLPAFIAKFERTLYEAGGQAWPDVNKISNFRNGLNSALRSRLAQQLTYGLPSSFRRKLPPLPTLQLLKSPAIRWILVHSQSVLFCLTRSLSRQGGLLLPRLTMTTPVHILIQRTK
jgi:hypothetical protein